MVFQCSTYASSQCPTAVAVSSTTFTLARIRPPRMLQPKTKLTCICKVGLEDIAQITQNKVLIAAGVSAVIGQLSKPFTSVLLYGKDFDLKTAVQAGGFPSTHSSAVVATATCLALERGFSDSIVGLTVVYAGLVMYDAQGVRREVGNHAKVLNKVESTRQVNSRVLKDRDDLIDSQEITLQEEFDTVLSDEGRAFMQKSTNASPVLLKSDNRASQVNQMLTTSTISATEELTEKTLKESIGHTEVEVIAGAFLGFFVSLAVYAIV